MPDSILRHTKKVTKISVIIAEKLAKKGVGINTKLVEKAALLHDLFKICDFDDSMYNQVVNELISKNILKKVPEKKLNHAKLAGIYFTEQYPKMAEVIAKHNYMAITRGFETWEEKVLYYADKRVMHDKIVSLKRRLAELHVRYGKKIKALSQQDIRQIAVTDAQIVGLEANIFKKIGIKSLQIRDESV